MNENVIPAAWVGQLIDRRFPLLEWLGSAESGEIFRTELPGEASQKAAIRLLPDNIEGAQTQFDDWAQAEGLSHPHLLRIFESGHGRIDETELFYVVMELPDEALSQLLPTRALTRDEAREMLPPVLDVLGFLHAKGLVHGHVNPANILVVGDHLKLSADKLQQDGRFRKLSAGMSIYDAPEIAGGRLSPASDIWSLGVTLVEGLTQLPPIWNIAPDGHSFTGDPKVPQFVPEPFATVARMCLRFDPSTRATLAELDRALSAPATRASSIPGARPSAPPPPATVPPTAPPPEAKTPPRPPQPPAPPASFTPAASAPSPRPPSPRTAPAALGNAPRPKLSLPVIIGAIALLAVIIAAVVVRSHKSQPPPAPDQETQTASAPTSSPAPPPQPAPKPAAKAPAETAPKPTPEPQAAAPEAKPQAAPPPPVSGRTASEKGAVADRVMPEPSSKASQTIRGKVSVKVRLSVDSEGKVTDASFDSPGPSRYFSNLALQAAHKWRFKPAQSNGQPAPSEWTLHFEFRRGNTDVTPVEVKP